MTTTAAKTPTDFDADHEWAARYNYITRALSSLTLNKPSMLNFDTVGSH